MYNQDSKALWESFKLQAVMNRQWKKENWFEIFFILAPSEKVLF